MNQPYIGVTDFVNRHQVKQAVACLLPWTDRRIHVGAMMSYKTLNGIPTSSGWEKIWLDEKGLNELFVKDRDVFNVLHYADYPDENGKVHTASADLIRAVKMAGPDVEGIQLDMIWPNAKHIIDLKQAFPDLSIIMQVSSKAIAYADKHDMTAKEVLQCYNENEIDYVLLDSGMGRGIEFDPKDVLNLIADVSDQFPQEKIAVAGGLGPNTYNNLKTIFARYPKISCDAQGQLRASGSAKDPLDMQRVNDYIGGVCKLL